MYKEVKTQPNLLVKCLHTTDYRLFCQFFLYNPVFSVNLRSDIAWPIIDYNNSRVGPLIVQHQIGLKLILEKHSEIIFMPWTQIITDYVSAAS